jgi:VanZ family protein
MAERAPRARSRWRLVAVLAGLAVLAQLWGLYRVAGPPSPPWFPQADKLQHLAGFALPVGLVLLAVGLRAVDRGHRLSRRALVLVVVAFGSHAVLSEVVQHLVYLSRTGDGLDVVADLVGVALGTAWALAALRRSTAAHRPGQRAAEPSRVAAP